MGVRQVSFGGDASLFYLEGNGVRAAVSNYGAALVSLWHPDGTDVVLGYENVGGYIADAQYMGIVAGRYANRIANGRLLVNDDIWQLFCNDGPHHLHGGKEGFGRKLWQAETDEHCNSVQMTYFSPHLEEGYPGNLSVTVTYQITEYGSLQMRLAATADRPTVVNLTGHAYFNLAGSGDVLGHSMESNSSHYTPVDEMMIPTGEVLPVAGTQYDYRQPRILSDILDTNFVIDGEARALRPVAKVQEPLASRTLSVGSTLPASQIYVGGGHIAGGYSPTNAGFCIEPQYFPDSPNQTDFETPLIDSDHPYSEIIEYFLNTEL